MSFRADLDFSLFANRSIEERLVQSAAKIALYNFHWRFITFLFFNTSLLYGENYFAKFYNKSVIVGQGECDTPFAQHTKQHVLLGIDNNNIKLILNWMQNREFDNTGKHIIICLSEDKEDCNESEAMHIFWNFKVINVVFMRRAFNEKGIVGFTYYPLEDSLCAISPPVRLNKLDACIDSTSENNCKMFPEKLKNFHGCSLTVSTFEHAPFMYIKNRHKATGVDGDLLWLLGEGLNATFQIMMPRKSGGWGIRQPNGSWIGSLGDVYDDIANFSLTFPAITFNRSKYFDMSIYYNFLHVGWITCPAQFETSSLKLLHPFDKSTHIAIATMYIFVIASALLTKTKFWTKLSSRMNMDHPRSSVVFYSWMLCMGLPTHKLPKKPILLVIVYIWVWYTFLIRTVYQAALINSLKHNVHLPNYDTLEAALDADFQVGGGVALREYYSDNPTIFNKWIGVNESEIETTLLKVSEGFKFVQAMNEEYAKLFKRKFKNRKLHILPQKIVVSPTVVYFKKFSPFVESFNRVLRWLIETGFTKKLYDNYTNVPINKDPDTDKSITLEHFKGCYIILFTGWIVSFVIFLWEAIFGKQM